MLSLKRDFGFTYLYITHDLATAKFFCDRIAILYLGRIVEIGPSEAIYSDPKHPYTQALLRAIPEPDPRRAVPRDLPRGEVPDAASPPLGCSFHPRCSKAFEVCGWESRDLRDRLDEHWAQLPEDAYEAERATIGDLAALDKPVTKVRVPAGKGARGSDVLTVIERLRTEHRDEPLWRGVRSVTADDGGAQVEFHDPIEPRLLQVDDVQVECHLHDQ